MSRPVKTRDMAHWSVDFVEHLRLVHFTLVTLSGALLILILSGPTDTRISKARTQVTQLLRLRQEWPQIRESLYTSATRGVGKEQHGQSWFMKIHAPAVAHPAVYAVLGIGETELRKFASWKFEGAAMESAPGTLTEFQTWWDGLRQSSYVVGIEVPERGKVQCTAELDIDGKSVPNQMCEPDSSLGRLDPHDESIDLEGTVSQTFLESVVLSGKAHEKGPGRDMKVRVTVTGRTFRAPLGQAMLQAQFPEWRPGPFPTTFPELAAVSEGLYNISLENLASRLSEMEPKSEPVLEALGLKLPVALLTQWGTVILLVSQLYFWLHLHEFRSKASAASAGLDVAWIGVYRSRAALAATLVSACVVPAMAMAELIGRMPTTYARSWPRAASIAITAVAACAGTAVILGTAERLIGVWRMNRGGTDQVSRAVE